MTPGKCGCGRRTGPQALTCSSCEAPIFWEYARLLPVDVYLSEELGWEDVNDDDVEDP
jgi:hypothetical protein